jgi:hypothetical protein
MKSVIATGHLQPLPHPKEVPRFPSSRSPPGGNILVRPVPVKDIKFMGHTISNAGFEAVIIDFGFAAFPRIKNPLINANNYKNIGISRKSDKHYDLHFFLNSVHEMVRQPQYT